MAQRPFAVRLPRKLQARLDQELDRRHERGIPMTKADLIREAIDHHLSPLDREADPDEEEIPVQAALAS